MFINVCDDTWRPEAADPVQLAAQVARAPLVWQFLVGFGEKKTLYRSQMAEVVGNLAEIMSFKEWWWLGTLYEECWQ